VIQDIPPVFLERMRQLLGDEFPEFVACYSQPPISGLRLNTLKLSTADFLQLTRLDLMPIAWCPAAFYLPPHAQPGRHPQHAAGLYYLQDPSAMLPAEVLAPAPGELVIDLAAAPGGKSTHLASLLQGEGYLVANEIHPRRVWELAQNLERWGVKNASITNETPQRLVDHFGACFDKVLLDAPCSGEGMFRKSEAARLDWSPALVESCARRQSQLIEQAARLVRPGGSLLYTTCTFSAEEDEGVIAAFIESHPEFELQEITHQGGFASGYTAWNYGRQPVDLGMDMEQVVRLYPHRIRGEGHFLALLRRMDGETARSPRYQPDPTPTPQARRLLKQFSSASLSAWSDEGRLAQHGSYLYKIHPQCPDLKGLHVIHPGLWLGTLKVNRFEPSQALAMILKPGEALRVMQLDEDETVGYLQGKALPAPQQEAGWTLLTIDGFPLGWGKCSQGVVKNYYPRGLRWQA
jgi:NOL1/NOP2/sun family putative RNA methylase